eukprot:TRINITY_DN2189_c0_g1_i1.p1 TRINITY_DN2189_c0_g1~~TRINITY_DN2189_c0_g1_i1.p1  ORF type:complete len:68 (-),score=11.42 TRINITY_DN2189_c0_g1_i1:10-213(-)
MLGALFNFDTFMMCLLLVVCTSAYLRDKWSWLFDPKDAKLKPTERKPMGFFKSIFYKSALIGQRLSE